MVVQTQLRISYLKARYEEITRDTEKVENRKERYGRQNNGPSKMSRDVSGTYEYVRLYGKRGTEVANQLEIMSLAWIIQVGPM